MAREKTTKVRKDKSMEENENRFMKKNNRNANMQIDANRDIEEWKRIVGELIMIQEKFLYLNLEYDIVDKIS